MSVALCHGGWGYLVGVAIASVTLSGFDASSLQSTSWAHIIKGICYCYFNPHDAMKEWPSISKWKEQNFLSIFILTQDVSLCEAAQLSSVQFSSVAQSCPTVWDPMDWRMPGTLSITNSRSLLKLMSIESVMSSNHLTLCRPLLLLLAMFPSIRVFSNESALQVAKVLEFQLQHQSFWWIFRIDFL